MWKGPYEDGLTQSMVAYWMKGCPHRFYIRYILNLREKPRWNHKMEYGSMFHEALEHWYEYGKLKASNTAVDTYVSSLQKKYPTDATDIAMWGNICKQQFQLYTEHWKEEDRWWTSHGAEEVFDYEYTTTNGYLVRLRGKIDEVLTHKGSLYLGENKCKGYLDVDALTDTLHQNLQVMTYLTPLQSLHDGTLGGVRYNVIRRPLADQRAIKKRTGETIATYLERVFRTYQSTSKTYDGPYPISSNTDRWFYRIKINITEQDLQRFNDRTLSPVLEAICNWWESIDVDDPWCSTLHYLRPLGLYEESFDLKGDYYDYINTGSKSGLIKGQLFGEL